MTIAERVAKRDSAGAKLRVDSYVRVSSVSGRGGESFISPDEQRERIEHWAKSKGWEIAEVFQELDVSGRQMDRPKLNEVLRRIEAGESDGVVFYNVSRFARNVVEGYRLIERIDAMGGEAASVQESF